MKNAHIKDKLLRSVLDGDLSEDALCYAITYSWNAAMEDRLNTDIPREVSADRMLLAAEAEWSWNEDGDAFAALEALRRQWSWEK